MSRWKLTRRRNRGIRSGWYKGLSNDARRPVLTGDNDAAGYEKLGDASRNIPLVATPAPLHPANKLWGTTQPEESDRADNFLSRWRRAKQARLEQVHRRHTAETNTAVSEDLRRYEIERASRLKEYGAGGLSVAAVKEIERVKSPERAFQGFKGAGIGKETQGDDDLERKPSWEKRWRELGSGTPRRGPEFSLHPALKTETTTNDPWPSSPTTTVAGSELDQRGSGGGSGGVRAWRPSGS